MNIHVTCCILWTFLTFLSPCSSTTDSTPTVYDPETNQYYPISEFSLREDPPLLLPDPDPKEFPPEYLESLLKHCDDPTPGVWEFLQKSWIAIAEFGLHWERYPVTRRVFSRILCAIRLSQVLHAFLVAIVLSSLRYIIQKCCLKPLSTRLGIPIKTTQRLLESSWKSFWFLILWLCTFKTLILSGRTDFQYPLRIFKGVQMRVGYFDIPTPPDYYVVYTLQLGFYLHSVWSVLFVDAWRKDSLVLIIHHFLTLLLLQFSLVLRVHRVGALVLFLHDLNDVFLELAKVNVYLQVRHGRRHSLHVHLSNVLFIIFAITWILMRLYWFPLKVLYATSWGLYITNVGRECRSFLFFNVMLWALFFMHIYWFRLIGVMAVRLIICPTAGDVREDDASSSSDETTTTTKLENGSVKQRHLGNHNHVPNGVIVANTTTTTTKKSN